VQLAALWLARLHNSRLQLTPQEEFIEREEKRLHKYVSHFEECRHPHTRRARTNLSIANYLIKLGLGDSENLYRVLVEAENAMAQFSAWRPETVLH
jgi:hypothetical protein